ncbi:MAG: hypothetical protein K9N47_29090, partial [Prosthecobacter sp.]|nr:hypothetical protein [Prosthecobacter sp.]
GSVPEIILPFIILPCFCSVDSILCSSLSPSESFALKLPSVPQSSRLEFRCFVALAKNGQSEGGSLGEASLVLPQAPLSALDASTHFMGDHSIAQISSVG